MSRFLDRWPHRRRLPTANGRALYAAEADGRFYLIVDESEFYALLEPEDKLETTPVQIHEFRTEGERAHFLALQGWGKA